MTFKEILRKIKKVLKVFFRVPKGNSKSIEEQFIDLLEKTLDSIKDGKEQYLSLMKAIEPLEERYKNIMRKMGD